MAMEIEQFLMMKFIEGLGDGSSKVPLYSQFVKLKGLFETKMRSSSAKSEELREDLYYINNALNECRMLSSKHNAFVSVQGQWFLNNIRTSLNKKIKELQEANIAMVGSNLMNGSKSEFVESLSDKEDCFRWSSRSIEASKVHGFDDEVIMVERMLIDRKDEDRFKAIGIVGTGGVGKTTLAQLIFNKKEIKKHFLPRIWVCMSKNPKEKEDPKTEIVKRMLMYLGVEEKFIESVQQKHDLKGLIYALHLQLKGKRYLIVLDDAWDASEWYGNLTYWPSKETEWSKHLAYGLPKGNGGTVIVTSRSEELAEKMVGKENIRRLRPISNPEICWSIFKDEVTKNENEFNPSESEMVELKSEVLQKSAGLPLAAKTMGKIMYEQIQEHLT